ncbi:hypothetical protein [Devosia sp. 2618]|uniref:hypothetical protein n=1 Tax=Devosia sp. 2618 TaxID=3156454 RepID=UPI0033936887
MTNTITVLEAGQELTYGFADLARYHGFGFPGGVAHSFKVMQRALPLLGGETPPERREITIRTPFKGPGARDGFEMVTRATTEGRYIIDDSLLALERGEFLKGYVFVLGYRGKTLKLTIREGIVREEFILLSRKPDKTAAENKHLVGLKQEMADRLLVLPAVEAYDVVEID